MSDQVTIKLEKDLDHSEAEVEGEIEILPTPEKDSSAPVVSIDIDVDLGELYGNIRDGQSSDEPINKKLKLSAVTQNSISDDDATCSTTTATTTINHDVTFNNNDNDTSNQSQTTQQDEILQTIEIDVIEGEILIQAKTREELVKLIYQMTKLPAQKLIQVTDININTSPEDNLYLKPKQFLQISSLSLPQLYSIHIHANIHETVTANFFEDLFVKFGETLTHFRLTGGYIGIKKEHFVIRLPPLPKLETLYLQSEYTFEPSYEIDKGVTPGEIVEIDDNSDDEEESENSPTPTNLEPFQITIYLPKLKKLRELHLGSFINVITTDPLKSKEEEFYFDYFENLQVFHVGSSWHKVVKYIPKKYQKFEIKLTSLQFPDFLSQPAVIDKIAEEFPKLTIIRLNLPSPEVLQRFFQIFSKISIKGLHLKTSYVFEETLERVLCGTHKMVENEEAAKIAWFRKYGNFEKFQNSEAMKKKLTGLGGLKNLYSLDMFHTAQKIHFPHYNRTLGFDKYIGFPKDDVSLINQLKKLKRKIHHFHLHGCRSYNPNFKSYLRTIGFNFNSNPSKPKIPEVNRLKISMRNLDPEKSGTNVKREVKKEKNT